MCMFCPLYVCFLERSFLRRQEKLLVFDWLQVRMVVSEDLVMLNLPLKQLLKRWLSTVFVSNSLGSHSLIVLNCYLNLNFTFKSWTKSIPYSYVCLMYHIFVVWQFYSLGSSLCQNVTLLPMDPIQWSFYPLSPFLSHSFRLWKWMARSCWDVQ